MIYIITHKKFDYSKYDADTYKVMYVGKGQDCSEHYFRDNIGDNIAEKNPNFCELTGLYWIWKNGNESENDNVGLVHYRRFFTTNREYNLYKKNNMVPYALNKDDIRENCNQSTVIMPKKLWTIRSLKANYIRVHSEEDYNIMRDSVKKCSPSYLTDFDKIMNGHCGYYFNMIICQKSVLNEYCRWLFNIMDELERRIDLNKYEDNYQKRVFGFMSERLLQVWIKHNNYNIVEYPVFNTENKPESVLHSVIHRIKAPQMH